jgi:hypothetical protein
MQIDKKNEDSPLGIMERKTRVNINVHAGYRNNWGGRACVGIDSSGRSRSHVVFVLNFFIF